MTTAPDWLRESVEAAPRTRRQRLRRASGGQLVLGALLVAVVVSLVWSLTSFGVRLQARGALRAALEDAALQALPPGLPVELRGVYAVGDAEGYATAFSPLPPDRALDGHVPAGGSRWAPIEGADTPTSRAWLSASGRYVLTIDALSCASARAPAGCPAGGSSLAAKAAPGGPNY